nr:[Fe-Fe] hydrogenase large subunit C-terminal domain-containing protein [Sedimentibacter sp. zth1]
MRKFDSHVQYRKYNLLKEIVKSELNDTLVNDILDIPKVIVGPKAETRCCIYKERAIVTEKIKNIIYDVKDNVVNTIEIACDECPVNRFSVTEACRGCLAHHCVENCPVGAISIINKRAHIDQDKCIECGKCHESCQFEAISDVRRPCIKSCKMDALKIDPSTKKAMIVEENCVSCGACVAKCPFGAIVDKSYLLNIVKLIKESNNNQNYKVYAVVAPAIAAQFAEYKIEQVIEAIKKLGFYDVVEAAVGADIIAHYEANLLKEELGHKKFITSSCCPAFVALINKNTLS